MAGPASKPYKWFVDKPDGTQIIMRRAYDPRYVTFPAGELEHFDAHPQQQQHVRRIRGRAR